MRPLLVHLRLHFQLLLAPVYLWGWLIAGGGLRPGVLIGFVAFHAFLYSGATAFNSYYDRDRGPVGGLERPPSVSPSLLPFSLTVQAAGWLLSLLVNLTFWVAYGVFVLLSVAYSHPRIRVKAHTVASLILVGLGQGALAFLAAWAATRGDLSGVWSVDGGLGCLAAVFLILSLYPLTQLYQIDEDAARGDRTLAVALGPARCFVFSIVCTMVGGAAMVTLVAGRFGWADGALVSLGLAAQLVVLVVWSRRFHAENVLTNFRSVMRLNTASAAALGAYLLARLALGGR